MPYNTEFFAQTTAKQKLTATPIEKEILLSDMASLLPVLFATLPLDDDDMVAIRRKVGFLKETLPEAEDVAEPVMPDEVDEESEVDEEVEEGAELAEMQGAPFPDNSQRQAAITDDDKERAESRFVRWARNNAPWLIGIFGSDDDNGG